MKGLRDHVMPLEASSGTTDAPIPTLRKRGPIAKPALAATLGSSLMQGGS